MNLDRARSLLSRLPIKDRQRNVSVPFILNPNQIAAFNIIRKQYERDKWIRAVVLKARRVGMCLEPHTAILTTDFRWKSLDEAHIGEEIITVDELGASGRGVGRKLRVGVIEGKREVFAPAIVLRMDNGQTLTATKEHRFLMKRRGRVDWKSVNDIRVGDRIRHIVSPWSSTPTFEDGWFGGLLDGEGSIRPKTRAGVEVTITQVGGLVLDRARKYLQDCGYAFRETTDKNRPSNDGYNRQYIKRLTLGRMPEIFRLLGQTRPVRLLSKGSCWQGKELPGKRIGGCWGVVTAIEKLPAQRMLDIQTSTQTFIANGFVSHNSSFFDGLLFVHCLARPQAHAQIVAHLKTTSETGLFRVPRDLASGLNAKVDVADVRARNIFFRHASGDSLLDLATAGTTSGGRGLTLSALHLSEAAQFPGEDSFLSLLPAVSEAPDTLIAVESTAFGRVGVGQMFYEFWNNACAGKNGYVPIFLSWLNDPDCVRDEEEADDAPATDLERELMGKPYYANKAQIAWMRLTLEAKCKGEEPMWLQEYPHCVTRETRVSTDLGIIPIESAGAAIFCESGKIEAWGAQPIAPIYRLETKAGRVLRGTANHPVCLGDGHYEYLSRLSPGQKVELCVPRFAGKKHVESWSDFPGVKTTVVVDELWAKFLGYFMGDGSYYKRVISVVCDPKDVDVQADVEKTITQLFGRTPQRREIGKVKGRKGAVEFRLSAWGTLDTFQRLGIVRSLNNASYRRNVCVPEAIFRSPVDTVAAFLSALFECDGSASGGAVRFASSKRQFIRDIQLLLLGFGISSHIYANKKKGGSGKDYICYELAIHRRTVHNFRFIGFRGERKNTLLAAIACKPSTATLFDEVKSVIEEEKQEVTYDFTISDSHAFLANGILTHNTAEVAFVATGDPAFPKEELGYALTTKKPPEWTGRMVRIGSNVDFEKSSKGELLLWEKPKKKCFYYIGGDAAAGYETGDFAALVGWNGTTGEQAFRLSGHLHPEELADEADKLGRYFNQAMVNIELTGNLGRWAQKLLRDRYMYPNIYVWKGKDDRRPDKQKGSSAHGWETTQATRGLMFDAFREALRAGRRGIPGGIEIYDEELVRQMDICTFREGLRWDVEKGHDDILVASMLCVVTMAQYPPPNILAYVGQTLETNDARRSTAMDFMKPQPSLDSMLKKDLEYVFRRDKAVSKLGRI